MVYLGVDIGGTNTKMGLVEDGNIIARTVFKTSKDFEVLTDDIKNKLEELKKQGNVSTVGGIGIGCPGAIDSKNGVVDVAFNLGWKDVKLKEMLEKKTGLEVRLSNDANVAGLGETIYGNGKGFKNVIVITLGTGVGGAIIIDGKMYEGNQSKGAELGHILLRKNGRQCTCGRRGCAETYVAASRFLKEARSYASKSNGYLSKQIIDGDLHSIKCETVYNSAEKDDGAKKIVEKYISDLGEFVMDLCNIFRPEVLIIGGGMSYSGEKFINRLDDYCKQRNYGFAHTPPVLLRLAKLQNDAGLIGGACLFM